MHWGNPEKQAAHAEALQAKPFEILTNQVPESAIRRFMEDRKLMTAIELAGWPTDEEGAEAIAKRHDMGAEQVAAIAKYHHGIQAEHERGATH